MLTDLNNPEALFYQWQVYGHHNSAIKICNMAITGNIQAKLYAEKIWKYAKTRNKP